MSTPRVSVIVPCFNAGPMLEPALASIVGQTHPAIELIVVDNASTDASAAVAEAALAAQPRPFRFVRCETPGANAARNVGYALRERRLRELDGRRRSDRRRQDRPPGRSARSLAGFRHRLRRLYVPAGCRRTIRRERQTRTLAPVKDQLQRVLSGVWVPPHALSHPPGRRRPAAGGRGLGARPDGRRPTSSTAPLAALMGMKFLYVPGAHVTYNIWSKSQISGRTPFDQRLRTLEAIFRAAQRPRRRASAQGRADRAPSPTAPEPGLDGVAAAAATPCRSAAARGEGRA